MLRERSLWVRLGAGAAAVARARPLLLLRRQLLDVRIKVRVEDTQQSMVNTIETMLVVLGDTNRRINVLEAVVAAAAVVVVPGAARTLLGAGLVEEIKTWVAVRRNSVVGIRLMCIIMVTTYKII